jgi:hypothetical protein
MDLDPGFGRRNLSLLALFVAISLLNSITLNLIKNEMGLRFDGTMQASHLFSVSSAR